MLTNRTGVPLCMRITNIVDAAAEQFQKISKVQKGLADIVRRGETFSLICRFVDMVERGALGTVLPHLTQFEEDTLEPILATRLDYLKHVKEGNQPRDFWYDNNLATTSLRELGRDVLSSTWTLPDAEDLDRIFRTL